MPAKSTNRKLERNKNQTTKKASTQDLTELNSSSSSRLAPFQNESSSPD